MRNILLIIPAILLLFISCGKNKNVKNEYNSDGKLVKQTVYTSPDKKEYREYLFYSDNKIQEIQEYSAGIKNGRSFAYYPDGDIKSVYYYNKGKLTSIGRYYNEDGRITDKGLFINDSLVAKEEFFYEGSLTRVNAFSRLGGNFREAGNLLYKSGGMSEMYAPDDSYFYIVHSLDSIPLDDSIRIDLRFIGTEEKGDRLELSLGTYDENFVYNPERIIESDSLFMSFYYHPKNKGYNLILGRLTLISEKPKRGYTDFLFYHDFLTY